MVPYVVLAVTIMHMLLFVLDVSMMRDYEGDGNAGVGDGGGVVVVSAWHEYVGGTRGLGSVSSATDVLVMSVVLFCWSSRRHCSVINIITFILVVV